MAQKFLMLALAKLPKARAGDEFETGYTEAKALAAIGKARYLTRDMTAGAPDLTPPPIPVVLTRAPIDATEAAIKLAAERGIDLATVTGTGKEGRILASDVEAVAAAQ